MKRVVFDSIGGASGDMILASLLDLGIDVGQIYQELKHLPIGSFHLEDTPVTLNGIRGRQVHVTQEAPDPSSASSHGHVAHRGLSAIRRMLADSGLPPPVVACAQSVFRRLAEAEAHIHNSTPDEIHFHEVGAVDSIVDICGCCLALHQLGVDSVDLRPLPLGHGVIHCAHGTLPSPAPATVELLKGIPVVMVDEPFELVTPTAAALFATWRAAQPLVAPARILHCGYGFGQRRLSSRPNLLRALLLEADDAATSPPGTDLCIVMECNLDDTTPELIGALTQRLLEHGALDVFTTAVQMKKQRPGTLLTVLCRPETRAVLHNLIFTETTTLGLRETPAHRTILDRSQVEVETAWGRVRVKIGRWQNTVVTRAPEFDDCQTLARTHNTAVRAVYEAACRAAQSIQ